MIDWVHPGAVLIAGSILIPVFKGRVKQAYLLLLPALAFLSVLNMSEGDIRGVSDHGSGTDIRQG